MADFDSEAEMGIKDAPIRHAASRPSAGIGSRRMIVVMRADVSAAPPTSSDVLEAVLDATALRRGAARALSRGAGPCSDTKARGEGGLTIAGTANTRAAEAPASVGGGKFRSLRGNRAGQQRHPDEPCYHFASNPR